MTPCASENCNREATKTICPNCIHDLQEELDKVPELLDELFTTMAKLDNTAPQRQDGGGGLTSTATLPIRVGAMELRSALGLWANVTAEQLAKDQYAGNFLPMLQQLISDAHDCIDNPPEQRLITTCTCGGKVTTNSPKPEDGTPDEGDCQECGEHYQQTAAMTRFRINLATPTDMQTRHALKWIRDNAGLSIKAEDVRNWAREGKLTATNPNRGKFEHPTYNIADILTVHYRHVERNKRTTNF